MADYFFVSDLHGDVSRYEKLLISIRSEAPPAVFAGGDLLPHFLGLRPMPDLPNQDFVNGFLAARFAALREEMGTDYPAIFLILGNDDPRLWEQDMIDHAGNGLWTYLHQKKSELEGRNIYGYACVPPTPFMLKDWERYDVSRGVDPGCVSPEDGRFSIDVPVSRKRYATIKDDLRQLVGDDDISDAIFLFHAPPYRCNLDRAALDGQMVDHVPLDVHIGSIAIQRFIETKQPLITLHGHVHESTRITGVWKERFGRTWSYNAAHDGPELSLIRFDPSHPGNATRELL